MVQNCTAERAVWEKKKEEEDTKVAFIKKYYKTQRQKLQRREGKHV